jgi:regulatory protein
MKPTQETEVEDAVGGRPDVARREADPDQRADRDPVQHARQWLTERGIEVRDDVDEASAGGRYLYGAGRPPPGAGSSRRVDEDDSASAEDVDVAVGPGSSPFPAARRPTLAHADGPVDRDAGPDADPESVARAIVLRKLAAQARTRAELSKALESKQVPLAAAAAVLDRMEAVGLVDDEEFARGWVESRQQRRHLSRAALRRELTAKGVDRDQIDVALEQVDGDDELEAARSLAAKKSRSMATLEPQVRYRRLAAMLARRGFSSGVIARVTAEALRDPAP